LAGIYGLDAGVNRLPKKWIAPVGGVNKELKEIYSVSGGVNRKIFSAGPSWITNQTYFNSGNPTLILFGQPFTGTTGWLDTVWYEFDTPIYLNYLTVSGHISCYPTTGTGSVSQRFLFSDGTSDSSNNTSKAVKRVTILGGWMDSASSGTLSMQGTLQVYSRDFGNFYLNQTGKIIA